MTQSVPSSVTSTSDSPTPRCGSTLVALTAPELDSFFPTGLPDLGADQIFVYHNPLERRGDWCNALQRIKPDVVVSGWCTPPIPAELSAPHGGSIAYVCHVSGSVRHVVSRELIADGLWVSNWGALVAPLVAEHALLLTLSALRNQSEWPNFLVGPRRQPKPDLRTRTLHGKRVALHGFGAIGQALIKLLRPFGVDITAYSGGLSREFIESHGVSAVSNIKTLCTGCDVLVSCEALTPATRGELNYASLSLLPESAVFVNVGRGAVVDESALIKVARERAIRVASDVFTTEPLTPDSPFLSLSGAILSPHIGGPTHDFYEQCGDHAQTNLAAFRRGELPAGLISLAVFDRST